MQHYFTRALSFSDVSKAVGFTASSTSFETEWRSGTLVFPLVITNVGNGYNPSSGIFTAPKAGEYVFFLNVQSYSSQSIFADIVLNGVPKVRTLAYGSSGNFDSGPNLALLTLQKQDRVWVKYYKGQGYYNEGPLTTFSGFII